VDSKDLLVDLLKNPNAIFSCLHMSVFVLLFRIHCLPSYALLLSFLGLVAKFLFFSERSLANFSFILLFHLLSPLFLLQRPDLLLHLHLFNFLAKVAQERVFNAIHCYNHVLHLLKAEISANLLYLPYLFIFEGDLRGKEVVGVVGGVDFAATDAELV